MDRHIVGNGTSEEEWLACGNLQALPTISPAGILPEGSRLVVCAPHPDDEILPCGGLLAALAEMKREIKILAITDGEASHGNNSKMTSDDLRRLRPAESEDALHLLGLPESIVRFGFPDGGLSENVAELAEAIRQQVEPRDILLTPWQADGHPDHEATWQAAMIVASEMKCRILETPIWGWHWSNPATTPMPWEKGIRINLPLTLRSRKAAAIGAFTSQLTEYNGQPAILSPTTLQRFSRPWEIYFR